MYILNTVNKNVTNALSAQSAFPKLPSPGTFEINRLGSQLMSKCVRARKDQRI